MTENQDEHPQKPAIEYPCDWAYKVIATNGDLSAEQISETLQEKKHTVALSNRSSQGKYVSFNIETKVKDEAERTEILQILQALPAVKMVI